MMFSPNKKFSLALTSFFLGLAMLVPRCVCHPIAPSSSGTTQDSRIALQKQANGIPFSIIARPEGTKISNYQHGKELFRSTSFNRLLQEDSSRPPEVQQCDVAIEAFYAANPSYNESFFTFLGTYAAELDSCTEGFRNCTTDFSDISAVQNLSDMCLAGGGQATLYSFAIQCSISSSSVQEQQQQQPFVIGLDVKGLPDCIPPGCDVNALIEYAAGSVDATLDDIEQSVIAATGVDIQCGDFMFNVKDVNGNSLFQATGDGSKTFAELVVASEQQANDNNSNDSNNSAASQQGQFAILALVVGFAVSFVAVV